MKYLGNSIGILCLVLAFIACETNDKGNLNPGQSSLPGMIYNTERQAVENAKITIGSKQSGVLLTLYSDIRGRFVIPSLPFGTYTITVHRNGCEKLQVDFQFLRSTDVLYLQIISHEKLANLFVEALAKGAIVEANQFLQRLVDSEADPYIVKTSQASLYLSNKEYDLAEKELLSALTNSVDDFEIYGLLADIAEKYQKDKEKARIYLQKAYQIFRDPEIESRLGEL